MRDNYYSVVAATILLLGTTVLLFTGYRHVNVPKTTKATVIHCQVSPDTWKRYETLAGATYYELTRKGLWVFYSLNHGPIIGSICHYEGGTNVQDK